MKKYYVFFVFLVSLTLLFVFRDVRVGLDGCAYAYSVSKLINGAYTAVFNWSHPLHVPLLTVVYLVVSWFWLIDVLTVYQLMDIVLGAFGLALMASLAFKLTKRYYCATIAWLLCLLSWGYWNQAATADEKMSGMFFVLILLYLINDYICFDKKFSGIKTVYKSFLLGAVFALSFLSHVSAVLIVPGMIFLIIKRKKYAFGILTAVFAAIVLLSSYLWFIYLENINTFIGTKEYFARGLAQYSIFGGFHCEHCLLQTYAQGITKLFFAVFREDAMAKSFVLALVTAVFIGHLFYIVWKRRRDINMVFLGLFLMTTLLFGFTYAPDNYSSYMLFLVPASLISALHYKEIRWFNGVHIFLLILAVHNIPVFVAHSGFFCRSIEKEYVMAVQKQLDSSDRLIVVTSAGSNPVTVARIHRYFNPRQKYIYFHDFMKDIDNPVYKLLAAHHKLYIEGICFEDKHNRDTDEIADNQAYLELSKHIRVTRAIDYAGYSDLLHRTYKHVYAIEYR